MKLKEKEDEEVFGGSKIQLSYLVLLVDLMESLFVNANKKYI